MKRLKIDLSSIFYKFAYVSPISYYSKQSFILKEDFKTITVIEFKIPNNHGYYLDLNYYLNLKQFKMEFYK